MALHSNLKVSSPLKIADLQLRNRTIRSVCFEGLCQDGNITDGGIEIDDALVIARRF